MVTMINSEGWYYNSAGVAKRVEGSLLVVVLKVGNLRRIQ